MNAKKYIILVLSALVVFSCDYLDYDESSGYEKEDMFTYVARAKGMVTNVYSYLQSDFGNFGGSTRAGATDEAEYVWNNSLIHRYNDGSWSSILTIDDVWEHYYSGIRAANMYLENYHEDFPDIQWNTDYQQVMAQYAYYPYEVRFLRAFFYFELIKRYKNVPLLTRTYELDEINEVEQADFEKIVAFIESECEEIKEKLPVKYTDVPGQETGRITQGAVLALKARTLLYAASPLHNPSGNKDAWKKAARAAKELIDKSKTGNWYSLVSESSVNNMTSKELILERRHGYSNTFESLNFPLGFQGGNSGLSPTQNLVDAFEMIDGSKFDWNNSEHVKNIYNAKQRDPRLFKTVIVNGSSWKGQTVESFYGGLNGAPQTGASKTSYYLKKYVVESVNLNPGNTTTAIHVWVFFRYAEVLLNYAEALYEAYENADYTDSEFTLSPRQALNEVRKRAGMPAVETGDFREKVRNERRVELAFEDHRFWDVRRWKIGAQSTDIYGVRIDRKGTSFTYKKELISKRAWDDKMNLYPIANSELFKSKKLKQNTGW